MAFNFATRHLSAQQQNIIRTRKENDERLKQESSIIKPSSIYEISIMMKLGNDLDVKVDGNKTMKIYKDFCDKNGSVWFSTNSHPKGIGKQKYKEFTDAINKGNTVEMFFIIGKGCNGTNNIEYRAEVLDIESDADGIYSPDVNLTPMEYKKENKKIWIKISNLQKVNELSVKDFVIASTKKDLKEAIEGSQYHFGYIKRK
ncbi:hypothetical protein EXM65_08320 [Clostridium botulinum]|uniref:Pua-like domain-containing protein n=1 Tax=Clostridium botulinum TaxID=1491 RepID=A0A6M0SMR9_CLOBO|nr:hypothetical protein [Clostridium botulinum]